MSRAINWPLAAEQLAARISRASLHPAVLAWADGAGDAGTRGGLPDGGSRLLSVSAAGGGWAVAFSGGADSLALLLLLWAHWPERRGKMVALHFNHRLRGRASGGDAAFCRRVCAALGVRFESGQWAARQSGASASEGAAREARFEFFHATQRRCRAPALWLGHQQDDIAETLLMRIARGSGTRGLAAPRPVQIMPLGRVHLRPLLTWRKAALVAELTALKIPWREDGSNAQGAYFRNRVRQTVLAPWIAAAGRDALAGAALSRALLEEDDNALETWVDRLAVIDAEARLNVVALHNFPRAVQRRALHRWLATLEDAGDLSRQGFEALLDKVAEGKSTRFSIGSRGLAVIRKGLLSFMSSTS